jgi:hypothetical protein
MATYTADEVRAIARHSSLLGFQHGFRCKTASQMAEINLDSMCAQVLRQIEHDGLIQKEIEGE